MGPQSDEKLTTHLKREVLYPQRQNTGVGVMLVASAAMFFAVASSAFILRSQMPNRARCIHRARPVMAVPPSVEDRGSDCGTPEVTRYEGGEESIVFRVCR